MHFREEIVSWEQLPPVLTPAGTDHPGSTLSKGPQPDTPLQQQNTAPSAHTQPKQPRVGSELCLLLEQKAPPKPAAPHLHP